MKTKEKLNALKEEAKKEAKPEEKGSVMLTDEDLKQVTGGSIPRLKIKDIAVKYKFTIDNLT